MPSFDYDLIIIGGGSAGLVSSKLAAGLGKKVLIIEKKRLGGDCTWTGCIPSKTLIKSALIAHSYKNTTYYGLEPAHESSLKTDTVMAHAGTIRQSIYDTHTPQELKKEGIETLFGSPRFINNQSVQVDGNAITAKKFIIATGASPFIPPIQGLDKVPYYTNETIFDIEKLPASMIILGGGPIGIELGSAFNRLGVKTTIIEMNERILAHDDPELTNLLHHHLEEEGLKILTNHKATNVSKNESTIAVETSSSSGEKKKITADALLVATGRKPNVEDVGLETIGVEFNKKGITTNKYLQTSVSNIYASGDVVGPYMFSHMAEYQAIIATRNALLPWPIRKAIDPDQKIWVTFSDPELATAGLSEADAQKKYGEIYVYQHEVKKLDRAKTDRALVGSGKFICKKNGQLVGASILAPRAGELIHEVYALMLAKKTFSSLFHVVHAYPTYSELIWHAAKKAYVAETERNIFVRIVRKLLQGKKS